MGQRHNSGLGRKGLHEFCNSQQELILLLSKSLLAKQYKTGYCTRLGKENGSSSSSKVKEAKQAKGLSDSIFSSTVVLPLQLLTTADRSQSSAIFITLKLSYKETVQNAPFPGLCSGHPSNNWVLMKERQRKESKHKGRR